MVCIYCGNETQVVNSRHQKRNNQVWRRRRCLSCSSVFTSLESIDLSTALRVERSDGLRPFLTDLLFSDVLIALQDREDRYIDAREVTNTIIQNLLRLPTSPVFAPSQISQTTAEVLKRLDRRAWHRFSAEHPSVTS